MVGILTRHAKPFKLTLQPSNNTHFEPRETAIVVEKMDTTSATAPFWVMHIAPSATREDIIIKFVTASKDLEIGLGINSTSKDLEIGISSSDGRVVYSVCLLSSRLGFDSESGQTNDFNIGIHSFPAWRSALKGQCGEQAGKLTSCAVGKGT